MLKRSFVVRSIAALYEFVDDNFLNNKRPAVPGGAWPLDALRRKSLADLQAIWFSLVKERNMLATMKEHYLRHQEELGALPSPSRIKMVEESMKNIKAVVKERDSKATDAAKKVFQHRLEKGVYRYPPGPQLPPGAHSTTSTVKVILSQRIASDRIRELFGRYEEFEAHKGIVTITIGLSDEVLQQKKESEQLWSQYIAEKSDIKEYHKWEDNGTSLYDYSDAELVPGVTVSDLAREAEEVEVLHHGVKVTPTSAPTGVVVAATLPVPLPLKRDSIPTSPLERIRSERRSTLSRSIIQLGYFPNITLEKPRYRNPKDLPRPVHPDEIEGPWEAIITYDRKDGLEYAKSLDIKRIDDADVISIEAANALSQPYADVDAIFQEALHHEMGDEEIQMQWPHVPEWKYEYDVYTKKSLSDIAQYNYSNVVDYVDREVLLTGRSVWELPIEVDPTCGGSRSVPGHAKRPMRYMNAGISEVGVTDI